MALPFYDKPDAFEENVGLVAVEYALEVGRSLYRPTIADALSQPYFFPGPCSAKSGETCPLESTLDRCGPRSTAGVPEWIHTNYEVVLLPGSASDPDACRVVWYAAFD